MIRLTIRELLLDLRNMFRGWKLVIVLLFLGLVIIMSLTGEEDGIGSIMMVFAIWSTLTIKPKINKLYYLLPTQHQNRITYILLKSIGVFLFNMTFYIVAVCIMVILTDYQFEQELRTMLSTVIPFLISYTAMGMGTGYNWGKQDDVELTKKYQNLYAFALLFMIIPLINATFLFNWLEGVWYIALTIASYLCAVLCLFFEIQICRHTDFGYENIKKVEKIFS